MAKTRCKPMSHIRRRWSKPALTGAELLDDSPVDTNLSQEAISSTSCTTASTPFKTIQKDEKWQLTSTSAAAPGQDTYFRTWLRENEAERAAAERLQQENRGWLVEPAGKVTAHHNVHGFKPVRVEAKPAFSSGRVIMNTRTGGAASPAGPEAPWHRVKPTPSTELRLQDAGSR
ncbi:unnamed protein product [Pleuronectes platessa]|uniref:Uncharacterized protein n=1 Tax=Pleuronectes platessa TaxID=8262 RepID=A0A9N7YW36_PLEPL|nr:unnamed protein product [Pleuronectes platessa]